MIAMLNETKNALEGFEEVWSRVSGGAGDAPDESALLRGFITNAERASELYCLLARRMSGCADALRRLAMEERRTRRCMEGELFLLSGDSFCPRAGLPRGTRLPERAEARVHRRAGLRQGLPRGRQGHRVPPAADSVPAHGPGGAVPRRVSARPGDEVHIKSNRRRGNWEKPLDFAAVFHLLYTGVN